MYIEIAENIKWNKNLIQNELTKKKQLISKELKENEEKERKLKAQIIIVKTQNSPELIERFLYNLKKNISNTKAKSKIIVAILDDSTPFIGEIDYKTIIKKYKNTGIDIHYFRVNEQNSQTFIGKLRQLSIETLKKNNATLAEKKKMLLALQILISEEMRLQKFPDLNPENNTDGYIASHYSTVCKGHQSTDNYASLIGAYLLGKYKLSLSDTIITHNDDDIVYATLRNIKGKPEFLCYDFLYEREIIFSDPQMQFSAGKYVGVSGSPIRNVTTVMEIAVGILNLDYGHISKDANSPYYIYNHNTGQFKMLTVKEAIDALPQIIESYLCREPIAGFKTKDSYSDWLTTKNLRFDQGNYTMISTLEREFPSPTGGIIEFVQTGILKSKFRKQSHDRVFKIEEPILHVRAKRENGGDAFGTDIIGGAINSYAKTQLALYRIIQNSNHNLMRLVQSAYHDSGLTSDLIMSNTPNLLRINSIDLKSIKVLRDLLEFRLSRLKDNTSPLFNSLSRLLEVCSEDKLKKIENTWSQSDESQKEFDKLVLKGIKKFLQATDFWQLFFDSAYELGKKGENLES